MKMPLKVGDKVKVLLGKYAGKEDKVAFIDKKNLRVRLEKLKKEKIKTKKGEAKELHGTFYLRNLELVKEEKPAEQPKEQESTEESPAEETKAEAEEAKAE